MEQENIRFEKSDLPPDIIKVKVGKDGASLMPPETLTVKIDYSDSVCTADSWLYDVPDNTGKCNAEISFDMDADSFYNVFDGGAHYNAQKLASSVMPVLSTLPFKVEFLIVGKPYRIPAFFKINPFVKRLGIPIPAMFVSFSHCDSVAYLKESSRVTAYDAPKDFLMRIAESRSYIRERILAHT